MWSCQSLFWSLSSVLSYRGGRNGNAAPPPPPTTTTTTTKELISADSAPSLRPSLQVPTRQKPAPLVFALECERTLERREASVQDQLQIAQLPLSEDDGRQALSLCEKLLAAGGIARNQVLEDAACCLVSLAPTYAAVAMCSKSYREVCWPLCEKVYKGVYAENSNSSGPLHFINAHRAIAQYRTIPCGRSSRLVALSFCQTEHHSLFGSVTAYFAHLLTLPVWP